jgi:inositol phosphorylceramide mannosyltransferase catalytic subunit
VRIPRIFHQIWVGPDPLPDELAAYRETWARHHGDWEHRLWTEENLPGDLERTESYELLRAPAERADLIRVELLYRLGGVYVDLDFECLRPIDPLIEDVDFFMGYRKPRRPNNALIGSVAGHPILAEAIRDIHPRTTYGPVDKAGTGPLFWRALVKGRPEVTIFEQPIFYPETGEQLETAYAAHHQARTWQDQKTLAKRLVGTERLLREARDEIAVLEQRLAQADAELARVRTPRIRGLLSRK